ncbi:uncharacterized protein LOC103353653 [Stegastes partitus]|uniref:Uncharacterized LOC103353653 n=1 Tax=Stegastes partitus TaxID=144197 RepID=A0A3B5AZM5_9TELE|nr:PREDICTED: uncharacterized protein LOC103353653 [Stegastes partitus]
MASSSSVWIVSLFITVMTSNFGVFGRAVDTHGFLSQSSKTAHESPEPTLRTDTSRRSRAAETHRERCADFATHWQENTQQAPGDNGTLFQLHVRPFSPGSSRGLIFPGKFLFSFVRRLYRCCQEGMKCRSVKGIQGRLRAGRDMEFILTREILSLTIRKAELHLQLSNPQHLDIRPLLPSMVKHNLPTRFNVVSRGDLVELKVDLLFLFQTLQEVAGGARQGASLVNIRRGSFFSSGDPTGEKPSSAAPKHSDNDEQEDGVANTLPALDLGLILSCSQAGSEVSCGAGGVHLFHMPFVALYHR